MRADFWFIHAQGKICIFSTQWLCVPFALTNDAVASISTTATGASGWLGQYTLGPDRRIGLYIDTLLLSILGGIPWQDYFTRVLSQRTPRRAQIVSLIASCVCFFMAFPPVLIGAIGASTGEITPVLIGAIGASTGEITPGCEVWHSLNDADSPTSAQLIWHKNLNLQIWELTALVLQYITQFILNIILDVCKLLPNDLIFQIGMQQHMGSLGRFQFPQKIIS